MFLLFVHIYMHPHTHTHIHNHIDRPYNFGQLICDIVSHCQPTSSMAGRSVCVMSTIRHIAVFEYCPCTVLIAFEAGVLTLTCMLVDAVVFRIALVSDTRVWLTLNRISLILDWFFNLFFLGHFWFSV